VARRESQTNRERAKLERRRLRKRLVKWVGFSVGFPLVPFLILLGKSALIVPTVSAPPMNPLDLMILRGTLLALAVGLAAGAMGELAANAKEWGGSEVAALALSAASALAAMTYYALVSDAYATALYNRLGVERFMNVGVAIGLSVFLYATAIATGAWCVILTAHTESEEGG